MAENTWQSMGLDARVTRAINRLKWSAPTPVQASSIPFALEGKDVLAKAKTGSGKTAAYAVPIVQKVLNKKEVSKTNASLTSTDPFSPLVKRVSTPWYWCLRPNLPSKSEKSLKVLFLTAPT